MTIGIEALQDEEPRSNNDETASHGFAIVCLSVAWLLNNDILTPMSRMQAHETLPK